MKRCKYDTMIRKNTIELVRALRELGYTPWSVIPEDYGLVATMFNFRATSESCPDVETPTINGIEYPADAQDFVDEGFIDCGENEDLFLAIAAMSDDTDRGQWFVFTEDWEPEGCGRFVRCTDDDWEDSFSSWCADDDLRPYMFRKATVDELIDYFS